MMGSALSSEVSSDCDARGNNVANNVPALRFHQVHGENVRLSNDRTVARRVESFCKGITFSNRAVKPNEKIFIKFLELKDCWNGVVRFGFTNNDPANCRNGLPKYACPDLTNKPGYWAKALSERYCQVEGILHFYFTTSGDVLYGINGEEKGVLLQDIDTRNPLFMMIDIYGNSTGIEIIDVRDYLNNSRRNLDHETLGAEMERWIQPAMSALTLNSDSSDQHVGAQHQSQHHGHLPLLAPPPPPPQQVAEAVVHQSRQVTPPPRTFEPCMVNGSPARLAPRTSANHGELGHLSFHGTRGRNIKFNDYQNVAWRDEREFSNGYVFSSRPILPGETVVVQVRNTISAYVGGLGFGVTSCDPAKLRTCDLLDDSDTLLDRPEYWVVVKDVAAGPQIGDTLSFTLSSSGAVLFSKNNSPPRVVMHVDLSPSLWMFFDIYGSTQQVAVLGITKPAPPSQGTGTPCGVNPVPRSAPSTPWNPSRLPPPPPLPASCSSSPNGNPGQSQLQPQPPLQLTSTPLRAALRVEMSGSGSSPSRPATLSRPRSVHVPNDASSPLRLPAGAMDLRVRMSPPTNSSPANPPRSENIYESIAPITVKQIQEPSVVRLPNGNSSTINMSQSQPTSLLDLTYDECTICCEKSVDSVLYMCGHMCMCYECAIQQWRGRGGGQCPICRAVIRDVIRTYRP